MYDSCIGRLASYAYPHGADCPVFDQDDDPLRMNPTSGINQSEVWAALLRYRRVITKSPIWASRFTARFQ